MQNNILFFSLFSASHVYFRYTLNSCKPHVIRDLCVVWLLISDFAVPSQVILFPFLSLSVLGIVPNKTFLHIIIFGFYYKQKMYLFFTVVYQTVYSVMVFLSHSGVLCFLTAFHLSDLLFIREQSFVQQFTIRISLPFSLFLLSLHT